MTGEKRLIFPNLNGVRFIAAMMVVVHHIEQIKGIFGYPSLYRDNIYGTNIGGLGVTLFFVLSGFLITYLLLEEKGLSGTISLKQFYIRRVLRIWPLYYLIVLLAFFVIPTFFESIMILGSKANLLNHDYVKKLLLFLFFMPNVSFVSTGIVMFAAQLWSVGVEEQFYAIWPLLLKFFKKPIYPMLLVVVVFCILNFISQSLVENTGGYFYSRYRTFLNFILVTRIDCMAVGGIIAWFSWKGCKFLNVFRHWSVQVFSYLLIIILAYDETVFVGIGHLPYAFLFGIVIYNLAINNKTILRLENSLFNYGGKISYGIYMYQPLCIILVFIIYKKMSYNFGIFYDNIILYSFSILLTFFVSTLSYQLYERYFLSLKIKHSVILSGDNVYIPRFIASSHNKQATCHPDQYHMKKYSPLE